VGALEEAKVSSVRIHIIVTPSATLGGENHLYCGYVDGEFCASTITDEDEVGILTCHERCAELLHAKGLKVYREPSIERRGEPRARYIKQLAHIEMNEELYQPKKHK
jgi:hypothetical protein